MQNTKFNVDNSINTISNYAPVILFVTMFAIFAVTGYLQHEYYSTIFTGILDDTMYVAFLFPLIVQVLRLVTGFLSSSFFKKGKYVFGVMVFLFSLWLTVFEHNEAQHMGEYWTTIELDISVTQIDSKIVLVQDSIVMMVRILIWSALVLEFFLAFWLGMGAKEQGSKGAGSKGVKEDDNYIKLPTGKKQLNGVANSVK